MLNKELSKEDDPERQEQIKYLIQRMENQAREERRTSQKEEKKNEEYREKVKLMKEGKTPTYVNKCKWIYYYFLEGFSSLLLTHNPHDENEGEFSVVCLYSKHNIYHILVSIWISLTNQRSFASLVFLNIIFSPQRHKCQYYSTVFVISADKKVHSLVEQYEELKATGKLEKHITKHRKKNAQKTRKGMNVM